MPEGLAVDEKNQLQEYRKSPFPKQHTVIRIIAIILSVLFHPVFVPLYVVAFIVFIHPFLFAGFSPEDKSKVMIQAFAMFTFFPVITVLLLKAVKFIQTIQLKTQRDRIIPYVLCGTWYFWIWNVWRQLHGYPEQAVQFAFGITLASWMGLMANIYMKVSMHAIAMGVVLTFMILLGLDHMMDFGIYLSITVLITGLVCTSRFVVSDHTTKEVYTGLFLGILAQIVAHWLG